MCDIFSKSTSHVLHGLSYTAPGLSQEHGDRPWLRTFLYLLVCCYSLGSRLGPLQMLNEGTVENVRARGDLRSLLFMSHHTDGETEVQSLCGSHLHDSLSEALDLTGLRSWRGKISRDTQVGLYVTLTGHPLEWLAALSSGHQHSEKQLCLAEEARKG